MAVSATHTFNPKNAEAIEEAFERCGIAPSDLRAEHIRSAIRSANLVLTDWQNFGYSEYQLIKVSQAVSVVGVAGFALSAGQYDIFHATLKDSDGREREMYPISRQEYNAIHKKDQEGQPDRYFVDRSTYTATNKFSTVYLYQIDPSSTSTLEMWVMRKQYDAGEMQDTLDMAPGFFEAFMAGLAYFLSVKFAPDRTDKLGSMYYGARYYQTGEGTPGGALGRALAQNRETADAVFRVEFSRHRGRR